MIHSMYRAIIRPILTYSAIGRRQVPDLEFIGDNWKQINHADYQIAALFPKQNFMQSFRTVDSKAAINAISIKEMKQETDKKFQTIANLLDMQDLQISSRETDAETEGKLFNTYYDNVLGLGIPKYKEFSVMINKDLKDLVKFPRKYSEGIIIIGKKMFRNFSRCSIKFLHF